MLIVITFCHLTEMLPWTKMGTRVMCLMIWLELFRIFIAGMVLILDINGSHYNILIPRRQNFSKFSFASMQYTAF